MANKLTREQIAERLQNTNAWITTSRTALMSAVSASKIRYVISIVLNGDVTTSRLVDIDKLNPDGSYTAKFPGIPVAPTERVVVPEGWHEDIENPSQTLEGSANLYGKITGAVTGTSISATTTYYDNDV